MAKVLKDSTKAKVLDYGSGSGVLAICAAHLGAVTVVGVDVDEGSVDSLLRIGRTDVSKRTTFQSNAFVLSICKQLGDLGQ